MINFGELLTEGKASSKLNPITQAYSVIIWKDKFNEELSEKSVVYIYNEKEYTLKTNKFDTNILNVLLDNNKITEEDLKKGFIVIR